MNDGHQDGTHKSTPDEGFHNTIYGICVSRYFRYLRFLTPTPGFVASPAVGRVRAQSAAAARLGNNAPAAAATAVRLSRGLRGVMMMADPETTPEAPDTYTLVVVR